jgi:hypothetical protein
MPIDTSAWGGIQLDNPSPPPEDFDGLTVDEAVDPITEWFLQNFERPEDSTPRDDGDWVYIWGGPYEHRDIIEDLLGGVASDEIIEAAIDALDRQDTQWVPNSSRVQPPEEEDAPAISDDSEARIAHADMLRRVAALERTLAHITRPGIGHNHPDDNLDDVEPLTAEERQAITHLVTTLKTQPVQPKTLPAEVVSAPEVFASKAAKIMGYIAGKGDAFLQKAVEAAGTELGKWVVRATLWVTLANALKSAAKAANNWLHIVHLPF